jgi:polar amino acid transport system ATP-binding protein
MMAIMTIQKGIKYHGESETLHIVDLSIKTGEIVGIIGESGSGKSTLLQCLSQLDPFDLGHGTLMGAPIFYGKPKQNHKNLQHSIGYIFQDYCLWPHMSVLNNLILSPIHTLKMDKGKAIVLATHLLEMLKIAHKIHAYPHTLSGGQQQRVAIARCLMMSPKLIFMDEPTSALDPNATSDLMQCLKKLKEKGITIVLASHDICFIKNIADQVLFIHDGRIHEKGEVTLLSKPQTQALIEFTQSIQTPTH